MECGGLYLGNVFILSDVCYACELCSECCAEVYVCVYLFSVQNLSWAGRLASKQSQSTAQNRPLNSTVSVAWL